MTTAEDRRNRFNMLFEASLGNKTGTTRKSYKDADIAGLISNFQYTKGSSSSGSRSGSKKNPEIPQTVRELMAKNANAGRKDDGGFWDSIGNAIVHPSRIYRPLNHAFKWGMGTAPGKAFGKAVDIISRPGYAVTSAMLEGVKSINAGEPIWSLGDDALYGIGRGLSGKSKAGYGDVLAEAKRGGGLSNLKGGFGNALAKGLFAAQYGQAEVSNRIQSVSPGTAKWFDRGTGLVGDVVSDPTTYVSGGTLKALKEGSTLAEALTKQSTKALAQQTGSEVMANAVRKTTKEVLDKSRLAGKTKRIQIRNGGQFGKAVDVPIVDDIVNNVVKMTDNTIFDINAGALKGRSVGSLKETAGTYSHAAAEQYRTHLLNPVNKKADDFLKSLNLGSQANGVKPWSAARIAREKASDPLFKQWHDEFTNAMVGKLPQKADWQQAATQAKKSISATLDLEVDTIAKNIQEGLQNSVMNIPTLRFMGKDVMSFQRLAKISDLAFHGAGTKGAALLKKARLYDQAKLAENMVKSIGRAVSHTSQFPGYSTLISQKVRAFSNQSFKEFRQKALLLAKDTTKEDRRFIQHALEDPSKYAMLEPRLQGITDEVRNLYDEILQDEFKHSARTGSISKARADNYAYYHIRKTNAPGANEFLKARKGGKDLANYTTEQAAKKGYLPVEDAFTNLLMRKVKSNRKISRSMFEQDLATHYGIRGLNISTDEAKRRGLVKIADARLDPASRAGLKLKPGEHIYLDKDIHHVYENYQNLSKAYSHENEQLFKAIDYVTTKFKVGNTIYFPGFHIRNLLSDAFMGALDGVGVKSYSKIMGLFRKADYKLSKMGALDLDLGGQTVKYQKLLDSYKLNSQAGGFLSTDVSRATINSMAGSGSIAKDAARMVTNPSSIPSAMRAFSEGREDFGRFVHYYHAMSEEYPAALKKFKDKDKAWEAAVNASTARVNKFKFDYGALTRLEQRGIRRGMPFYTYMRKAIPTLIQSLYMSPRHLVYANKILNKFSQRDPNEWDGPIFPDYLQQTGFLPISGMNDKTPTGLTGSFLPTDVFNSAFNNIPASLNPLIKAPFELQNKKDTFTGKPVNGITDLLANNWRGTALWKKLSAEEDTFDPNDPRADPSSEQYDPEYKPQSGRADLIEKLAAAAGIPITTLSNSRQENQLNRYRGELSNRIKSYDKKANAQGKHIYLSGKNNIKVKDYTTGKIKTYPDLTTALLELQISP